ncbi:hypothetical protein [Streptomyces coriariae]|uniref:hypothetical protein n=1 Tax=Streptomyces coriariae TaxID=2864460 RepID=UPI003555FD62
MPGAGAAAFAYRDAVDRALRSGRLAGTREILESWFAGRPIRDEYLVADGDGLAGTGAHPYSFDR